MVKENAKEKSDGMLPALALFFENKKVADLSYDLKSDSFDLKYSNDWEKNGFPLSPHLLFDEDIPSDNLKKFLENLLPEEDGLRKLAHALKVSRSNTYALVAAIGHDATGAFSFLTDDGLPETTFREIPVAELKERIRKRSATPISIWDGKPRLSLAGVQEKLGITLKNGAYGLGDGQLASTHILKFSKKDQHLVLNEYFCMRLARSLKIPVANVELLDFGERVLQVERFDRVWRGGNQVVRRHIIDACQALNAPPGFKYQRVILTGPDKDNYLGPISAKSLSQFSKRCIVPAKAQLQLLRWILFNLLIGNSDNHGKNISYFVSPKGYEIAPAYDLVNVTVYEEFHQELAFKIGDTFDLDEVKAFQLAEMAKEMGLQPRFVASHLKKLCDSLLVALDDDEVKDLTKVEATFVKNFKENIKKRTSVFLRQSGLIAKLAKA